MWHRAGSSIVVLLTGSAFGWGQVPLPLTATPPSTLPASVTQGEQATLNVPTARPAVPLPQKELLEAIDVHKLSIRRLNGTWQIHNNGTLFQSFGGDRTSAEEVLTVLRTIRPTEWGTVGNQRPIVSYGLANGRVSQFIPVAQRRMPIDLQTLRVEQTQGVWIVRDDNNILLNFVSDRLGATQAVAVASKYGFNQLGFVGTPRPMFAYFYAAPETKDTPFAQEASNPLMQLAQAQNLERTGIPVPGLGFVGEQVRIDPSKLELRSEGGQWALVSGSDSLAEFGRNEWTAREALKVVQDLRATEFCSLATGSESVKFFLQNGKAPDHVPFAVQGERFDPKDLRVRQIGTTWTVYSTRTRLYETETEEQANAIIKVIQAYEFNQLCRVGLSRTSTLKFLARNGR